MRKEMDLAERSKNNGYQYAPGKNKGGIEMETHTKTKFYTLPTLPYDYKDLSPHISQDLLTIHHQKHHNAYVQGANGLLEKMDTARKAGQDFDVKATMKELSWNIGGALLHSFYWENMSPAAKTTEKPTGSIAEAIESEFGDFERFKSEFTKAAMTVEGSGWACLTYCKQTGRPLIMQVEKHNTNIYPMFGIVLVLDMFEHAYYLDYKNDKGKYVENFWKIINWEKVNERLEKLQK
jgi:superoxide dismutase, Fe-Mn family